MLRRLVFAMAFAVLSPAVFAQVCCPSGCVQDNARCIRAGRPDIACPRVACTQSFPGANSGGSSGGAAGISYPMPGPTKSLCCDPTHIPGGSYTKTCRDFEMRCENANELLATCRSGHGEVRSALPNVSTCRKIENINGELKCKKRAPRPPAAC